MRTPDPAVEVLAGFIRGTTLELGAGTALPGAELVALDADGAYPLDGHADESADTVVSRGGLEHALDTVLTLEQCRRVLRPGGRLALVIADGADAHAWSDTPHAFTPAALDRTLARVGGFEVVQTVELEGEGAFLVVAARQAAVDLSTAIGMHGAALAEASQRGPEHRAELLFQLGTMLLRAGEAPIARRCYEALHELDPERAECVFGLGMCHALERSWAPALTWLRTAAQLDPDNREIQRWLGLAQLEHDSESHGLGPQAAVHESEPARPEV